MIMKRALITPINISMNDVEGKIESIKCYAYLQAPLSWQLVTLSEVTSRFLYEEPCQNLILLLTNTIYTNEVLLWLQKTLTKPAELFNVLQ